MGGRGARSVTGRGPALFAAALGCASACNHAWDTLEPSSGATGSGGHAGGTGGAASTTSTASSTSTGTGGATTGTGGATTGTGGATTGTGGGTTTSSSSGTGGGGPTHCGGTDILSWDFSSDQPDVFDNDPEATLSGGEGVITLPAGQTGYFEADFATQRLYDLRSDRVTLEVLQIPNQAQGTYAGLELHYDNGDDLFLGVYQGKLKCGFDHNNQESTPMSATYVAATHRYWQIRESQGTVYCETSPDGATWSPAGSFDVAASQLATPSGLRVVITATTPGGMAAPGAFRFDDLNGGLAPTGKWCPALSYTDAFPAAGPVPGPAWDRDFTSDSADAYDQTGGTLNLHFGASSSSSVGYGSSVAYDLTGQRVSLQVITLAKLTQGSVFFAVGNNDNTDVYWNMHSDGFSCEYDAGGSNPVIWKGQAPTLPAWVGLRESGGSVYCEIYESGAWKSYASIGGTMDATRADVTIGTFEDSGTTPGSYLGGSDSYNLGPP